MQPRLLGDDYNIQAGGLACTWRDPQAGKQSEQPRETGHIRYRQTDRQANDTPYLMCMKLAKTLTQTFIVTVFVISGRSHEEEMKHFRYITFLLFTYLSDLR